MQVSMKFFTFVTTLVTLIAYDEVSAYQVGNNPLRREEILDPEGRFLLQWEVDVDTSRVNFNITVRTKGWVALGLSNDGPSSGADLVIGGVRDNGQAYLSDRHIVAGSGGEVILDRRQSWNLDSAHETRTHTILRISRAFDTCDPEDYAITPNQMTVIWAYGRNDNENGFNPISRGTAGLNLLDPDYAPQIVRREPAGDPTIVTAGRNENIPKDTKVWSFRRSETIPRNETSYFCSIHKAPRLQRKHHFIGFEVSFPTNLSRTHTHHVFMTRCHAPRGVRPDELFSPWLNQPGVPCYDPRSATGAGAAGGSFPRSACTEMYVLWGVGGSAFFLPDHVGFSFGENQDEYYMFQSHYDNPNNMEGLTVDYRVDYFYTSQLRPNEGAVQGIVAEFPGLPEAFTIPPRSVRHRKVAHCSSECTQAMYPRSGIRVSAVLLHSHNAGVAIRVRQFRRGRELPWIIYDDNYNNLVQTTRHLRREVRVLPGDQLTVDCEYTNNDTTTVGGFSTRQEMCMAFLFHYERVREHSFCGSELVSEEARLGFFGIQNVTWDQGELEWVVQTPRRLAGLTVGDISDQLINWTPERRRALQRLHLQHTQQGACLRDEYSEVPSPPIGPVSYPFQATPYIPPGSPCLEQRG